MFHVRASLKSKNGHKQCFFCHLELDYDQLKYYAYKADTLTICTVMFKIVYSVP